NRGTRSQRRYRPRVLGPQDAHRGGTAATGLGGGAMPRSADTQRARDSPALLPRRYPRPGALAVRSRDRSAKLPTAPAFAQLTRPTHGNPGSIADVRRAFRSATSGTLLAHALPHLRGDV